MFEALIARRFSGLSPSAFSLAIFHFPTNAKAADRQMQTWQTRGKWGKLENSTGECPLKGEEITCEFVQQEA